MDLSINSYMSYADKSLEAYDRTEKLKDTLGGDFSKASDADLMKACKEFEAYFLEQTFKAMEKMIPSNKEKETTSTLDMFKDDLMREYVGQATEREDFGLAQMLYEQMKRNYSL